MMLPTISMIQKIAKILIWIFSLQISQCSYTANENPALLQDAKSESSPSPPLDHEDRISLALGSKKKRKLPVTSCVYFKSRT